MPYIKKEFIDNLLEDVQIIDIVSEYTQLAKKGIHLFGLSPFTAEKSASFYIDQRKQRFYCKSSDKTGNAVSFLMQKNNMSYPEAIEAIAKIYNRPVQYADEKQAQAYAKKAEKKKKLRPILEAALEHYKAEFKKQPEKHPAKLEVFGKRQYTKEIILDWEIGYAPGGTSFASTLNKEQIEIAKEIGIVKENNKDKFFLRAMYPIHDINGLVVGFGGRDISGKLNADGNSFYSKWSNSSKSDIYLKSKIWYGLNKAFNEIIATGEANIVEGYNDVIAWHENGLTNTIASSGTAIEINQIKILKKYCKRINFTFDDDVAGKKAMLRYIPLFLAEGFVVNVQKTGGLDPDDFVREHKPELKHQSKIFSGIKSLKKDDDFMLNATRFVNDGDIIREIKESPLSPEKYALQKVLKEVGEKSDGFKTLLQEHLQGNAIAKSKGARKLCEIIATLEDEALKVIYIPWLKKESNISVAELRKWVKHFEDKLEEEAKEKAKSNKYLDYHGATADDEYTLPDAVTKKWEEVKNDVYQYGIFESDNRMWTKTGSEGDYTFKHITNCSIEILQHMSDEEFPMKLFKIKNVYNLEKIFDAPSEAADSQQRFSTILSNNGNFMYTGDSRDFMKLKVYLNDKMGVGRKIEVLGHQPEGFWAWNNLIQLYDGSKIEIDSNGLFIHKDVSYYIPSANKIYANNPYKFESQKKFKVQDAKVTFKTFASKAMEVHREFAISGILFGIASLFQDVIVSELNNFPILFLYGPAGTGKDQISELVQSFYGVPQQAQNLEGGASTIKAKIIKLSQFYNGIAEFSEYKRGDDKVDGILKGIWDRNGYERGNITSKIALETVPVLSSLILTGNDYPGQEALITRLFANEINKNEFSEEESKRFEEFKDMCSNGYSSYSVDILKEREYFKTNFQHKYRSFKNSFKEQVPDVIERMIGNASVLGATYEIFKNKLDFPFTFNDMEKHFKISIEKQTRKLASESIINKWWDCFLYGIKSPENVRIVYKEDFKLEGRSISFHFNQVYAKMAQLWSIIYKHEAIPGKTFLKDKIKSSDGFIKYWDKGLKMDSGRDVKTSSGYEMDLSKTGVYDEIFDATSYQKSKQDSANGQASVFTGTDVEQDDLVYIPPATPEQKISSKEEIREISDLQNTIVSEDEN